MCLDSKLLVMAEMFPSWPHKNILSPLERRHVSAEKCSLLWRCRKHLSIAASSKIKRKNTVWFSREVLGSTWSTISFYQRQPSSTSSFFFTIDQISCKSIPLLSRGEGRYPITPYCGVLAGIQSSLQPAACCGAVIAGRELV